MSEMFGTFALSVGAAVSPKSFYFIFLRQACLNLTECWNILKPGGHGVLGKMGS